MRFSSAFGGRQRWRLRSRRRQIAHNLDYFRPFAKDIRPLTKNTGLCAGKADGVAVSQCRDAPPVHASNDRFKACRVMSDADIALRANAGAVDHWCGVGIVEYRALPGLLITRCASG